MCDVKKTPLQACPVCGSVNIEQHCTGPVVYQQTPSGWINVWSEGNQIHWYTCNDCYSTALERSRAGLDDYYNKFHILDAKSYSFEKPVTLDPSIQWDDVVAKS